MTRARFATHPHPLGEEIFVLEGYFPMKTAITRGQLSSPSPGANTRRLAKKAALSWLNSINSIRGSRCGQINTQKTPWLQGIGGLKVMPLHEFEHEHTALVKWPKGETFQPHRHFGGEEILCYRASFKMSKGISAPHLDTQSAHEQPFSFCRRGNHYLSENRTFTH